MYVADQYRMPADEAARRLRQVRYANLVTVDGAGAPQATLLPWAFAAEPDRLVTHVAKVNDQWRHADRPALVVVDGLVAPVEARWKSGFEEGRSAPGLDYETVHVHGDLVADGCPEAVLDSWDRLLVAHESGLRLADMDPEYLARQAAATVALEVRVTEVVGKSKLSQANSSEDIRRIAAAMAPTCPVLASRLLGVALPYAEHREQEVERARRRRITAMAQRLAAESATGEPAEERVS